MKKFLSIVLIGVMAISFCTASFAQSDLESAKSGVINVDNIINSYKENVANKVQSLSMITESSKTPAGGGELWIEWGADRFTSCYDHDTKTHKTTAENGTGAQVKSGWVNATITARATIKATVSGNKAYWDTLDDD